MTRAVHRAATLALLSMFLVGTADASSSTSRLRLTPPETKPGDAKPADVPAAKPGEAAKPKRTQAKAESSFKLQAPDPLAGPALPPESASDVPAPPRPLPDGTLAVSAFWVTQEMLRDEETAKAKYAGKAMQFQGDIDYRQVDANGAALGFTLNIPMVGYRKFACHSYDPDSVAAARAVRIGQKVTMAGIYDPHFYSRINRDDFQKGLDTARDGGQAGLAVLGISTTLNFSDCLVLTGHKNGAVARTLMAAGAQLAVARPK